MAAVFAALLAALALGLWGAILRSPLYEIRGEVTARPAPGLVLVRHGAVAALGMAAMDLMAVSAEPALLDRSGVRPGDRVRMAVRQRDDALVLLRIDVLR